MACFAVEGTDLVLRLGLLEKVGALHGDIRVPLSAVRAVTVEEQVWASLRGWRSAGIALAPSVALGSRRHGGGWDFTVLHRAGPAIQVDLDAGRWGRIVCSVADGTDPGAEADRIAAAAGLPRA